MEYKQTTDLVGHTPTKKELNDSIPLISNLTDIVYQYIGNPFIIMIYVFKTIIIPNIRSENNLIIVWGDEIIELIDSSGNEKKNITHTYNYSGNYCVSIYGDVTKISLAMVTELIEISQWGNLRLYSGYEVFRHCYNLINITARDQPNLTFAINLSDMFAECTSLNGDLSKWDVSNIQNMCNMFRGCSSLNTALNNWDTSKVQYMFYMFHDCRRFNADLSKWNVSKVTDMHNMFYDCIHFNAYLSKWDTSNVRNMYNMFRGCKQFNADLSKWDVSKVVDMRSMFSGCEQFNANLRKWNISNVTNMQNTFIGCNVFDGEKNKSTDNTYYTYFDLYMHNV